MAKKKNFKSVETFTHEDASRKHIPTAECQSILRKEHQDPIRVAYERRNRDLDPQLVWRGKDEQDWSELVVQAPPLFIQEKVHPKVLIDELTERTKKQEGAKVPQQMSLFDDFNGLPDESAKTEFYQHDANWSNRMILGDSLQVMAALAEREGLRGKVQCVYFDPPYGIKFNSNFQWSTTTREVADGKIDQITRESEQVKAFRDTWRDGIHSYLTYIRDRLTVARDLLADTGSIFVQIGDENLHLIKSVLNEVFGEGNYVTTIVVKKKGSTLVTESVFDFLVWFAKKRDQLKVNKVLDSRKSPEVDSKFNTLISPEKEMVRITNLSSSEVTEKVEAGWRWARVNYPIVSQHPHPERSRDYVYRGSPKGCGKTRQWTFDLPTGMDRLNKAERIYDAGRTSLAGIVFHDDRPSVAVNNLWDDIKGEENPIYVVQTAWRVVQRCILMTTDPGDLVLDPTCGSGTTAYMAEHWGRRWITIDTSRVSLALARARIIGTSYPYYLLSDSKEGQAKEAKLSRTEPSTAPAYGKVNHGFVYERYPNITLKSIAHNAEVDVIWAKFEKEMNAILCEINEGLQQSWEEWDVPRQADSSWSQKVIGLHSKWWKLKVKRQNEIDASIVARADFEYLYDKPYEDRKKVRVAGPFTVESLSPHRVLTVDENDELVDELAKPDQQTEMQDFAQMVLENLKSSGVQQAHKEDKIVFSTLKPWPGHYVCAEGVYYEGEEESGVEKRAAIFIGPEFGTVSRPDLVAAAREAGDAGFDALIACAFNYDAHSSEFNSLGRIPVLKARMNADLHMADDLKNTGKGNLFVIFGEPDIDILEAKNNQVQVKINGVDVFHPNTGEVRSDGAEGIACWFIDTDYNEESFFVRHAYFLGANDPYKALKTTLKAEINKESWDTLNSDISRPFDKPESGRIAVKVINHLGDEVMKVYRVD